MNEQRYTVLEESAIALKLQVYIDPLFEILKFPELYSRTSVARTPLGP